ncbi:MAG: hypothetical protein ACHQD8_05945 [Chitinophagales bacterium]
MFHELTRRNIFAERQKAVPVSLE